ncbi:MAG: BMC domain-containing protein [Anaerovorax sp.]|nr:BMC domain-containing protein [Anaerovorax sp.]
MLKSLGLIETIGLAAAITAADAAVKSANVTLVGYELVKGSGRTVIKVEGDVGAVKAAIEAASAATLTVGRVAATKVIARPSDYLETMIRNQQTVGYHLEPLLKETDSLDQVDVISDSQDQIESLQDTSTNFEVNLIEEQPDCTRALTDLNVLKQIETEKIQEPIKSDENDLKEKKEVKTETKPKSKSSQKKTTQKSGGKVTKK